MFISGTMLGVYTHVGANCTVTSAAERYIKHADMLMKPQL